MKRSTAVTLNIYAENEGERLFAGWNWAAFFFGINWMFYRKMYKAAVICSFIYSLIAVLATPPLTELL